MLEARVVSCAHPGEFVWAAPASNSVPDTTNPRDGVARAGRADPNQVAEVAWRLLPCTDLGSAVNALGWPIANDGARAMPTRSLGDILAENAYMQPTPRQQGRERVRSARSRGRAASWSYDLHQWKAYRLATAKSAAERAAIEDEYAARVAGGPDFVTYRGGSDFSEPHRHQLTVGDKWAALRAFDACSELAVQECAPAAWPRRQPDVPQDLGVLALHGHQAREGVPGDRHHRRGGRLQSSHCDERDSLVEGLGPDYVAQTPEARADPLRQRHAAGVKCLHVADERPRCHRRRSFFWSQWKPLPTIRSKGGPGEVYAAIYTACRH